MGEHADDAIHEGLDQSWGWRRPSVRNIVCRHCGEQWLNWGEIAEDQWELQEWHENKFIKHSCKMKNRFKYVRPAPIDNGGYWEDDLEDEVPF